MAVNGYAFNAVLLTFIAKSETFFVNKASIFDRPSYKGLILYILTSIGGVTVVVVGAYIPHQRVAARPSVHEHESLVFRAAR